mmetsp:Transcript_3138/g.2608  ORF Transcript_3138/g.2608 Transcript_3138/m.2608 type:complete len:89 (+) Transcript_3138:861-1127(+)
MVDPCLLQQHLERDNLLRATNQTSELLDEDSLNNENDTSENSFNSASQHSIIKNSVVEHKEFTPDLMSYSGTLLEYESQRSTSFLTYY